MTRWNREDAYDDDVAAAALRYGVEAALIKAIIAVESGFNSQAINTGDPGYAWGLMQMIPATARGLGYNGPMDALLSDTRLAVDLGAKLLRENLTRAGSVTGAVSAYNGGYRPSLGFGQPKPGTGTYANQGYVDQVARALTYFRGIGTVAQQPSGGGDVALAGTPFRPLGDPGPGGDAARPVPPQVKPWRPGLWERFWRWIGGIEL